MEPNGQIFYQDEFSQSYRLDWKTTGGVIDFTSVIFQPYVWGELPQGYLKAGILFRRGVTTIHRQVLKPFVGGYEIVAEGYSQYIDHGAMNFPCQLGPTDPFRFRLDRPIVDDVQFVVTDGPRWSDSEGGGMLWGDLDFAGDPIVTAGAVFEFIDVWS